MVFEANWYLINLSLDIYFGITYSETIRNWIRYCIQAFKFIKLNSFCPPETSSNVMPFNRFGLDLVEKWGNQ